VRHAGPYPDKGRGKRCQASINVNFTLAAALLDPMLQTLIME